METQLALFGRSAAPAVPASFAGMRRHDLGEGGWVDHHPGWLEGHQELFDSLVASTAWQERSREMYGNSVAVPRLVASIPEHGPGHPLLTDVSHALTCRYGRCLTHLHMALYRDGRDSVAPHVDRVGPHRDHDSVVAILSLGTPRRFRLRRLARRGAADFQLGWGDLLVMGGTCQRHWTHAVPKAPRCFGARLSVMFREAPSAPEQPAAPPAAR